MFQKQFIKQFGVVAAMGLLVAGCNNSSPEHTNKAVNELLSKTVASELKPFGSTNGFDAYVDTLKSAHKLIGEDESRRMNLEGGMPPMPTASPAAPGNGADSITNNQEAGVDEGDIVKVHGDHFVILRCGRLFSLRMNDNGESVLRAAHVADAFGSNPGRSTWYDELLIYGNTIVVVGFSYAVSATEIALFDIDGQGALTHRETHFLRSNDYYSSRNYASRLADGKLIFYMPYYFLQRSYGSETTNTSLPAVARLQNGQASDWRNIIRHEDVYQPIQPVLWPVLHTIVTCDLKNQTFGCTAKSVIGPAARTFYVSKSAVYLWISEGVKATAYRLPFDSSTPGVVLATGAPTDQFSFKESDDGFLNVLLHSEGNGDVMWAPEHTSGDLLFARIGLSDFSSRPDPIAKEDYAVLVAPRGGTLQNRFVGNHLLYGTGSSWYSSTEYDKRVFVYPYRQGQALRQLDLTHGVDRIEVMGDAAVVIGSAGENLHFSAIDLKNDPKLAGSFMQANATQGETRSHGFFYKPLAEDQGILGLPIRSEGPGYSHLFERSAKVLYLRVNKFEFQQLGALSGQTSDENDNCIVSCVDWYGNSRPIFYRDRVFALLGYELIEGFIDEQGLSERARVNYWAGIQLPR